MLIRLGTPKSTSNDLAQGHFDNLAQSHFEVNPPNEGFKLKLLETIFKLKLFEKT